MTGGSGGGCATGADNQTYYPFPEDPMDDAMLRVLIDQMMKDGPSTDGMTRVADGLHLWMCRELLRRGSRLLLAEGLLRMVMDPGPHVLLPDEIKSIDAFLKGGE